MSGANSNVDFVLWDIGGVLQFPFERAFVADIAARIGMDVRTVWAKRQWIPLMRGEISESEYLSAFADSFNVEERELRRMYDRYFRRSIPGTLRILRQLATFDHGILSNHYRRAWEWLSAHAILDIIPEKNIFLSCDLGVGKPDSEAYQFVLRRIRRNPQSIVFVDNLDRNLIPARALGMHTIKFERSRQLRGHLAQLGISSKSGGESTPYRK
jgi:HAD superfamily hydrolase (TIGR01509 family)